MKKVLAICIIISSLLWAQDMRRNAAASMFSDFKASRIGDAITIYVVESSTATNSAETSAGKSSDFKLNGSLESGTGTTPKVNALFGTNNDFDGKGSTRSAGSVTTKISATIDSVLGNGNLRIRGSRKIVINGEEQTVSIKGIVRTIDISAENVVYSYNISDAEIVFEGQGLIQKAQSPGLMTKLFNWLF